MMRWDVKYYFIWNPADWILHFSTDFLNVITAVNQFILIFFSYVADLMKPSIKDIQQDCEVWEGVIMELSSPELEVG